MNRRFLLLTLAAALCAGLAIYLLSAPQAGPDVAQAPVRTGQAAIQEHHARTDDTTTPTAPVPAPTPAPSPGESRAQDPYDFIRSRLQAAYDGDGKAQYEIARTWDKCEYTLSLVRKSPDPEAALMALPPSWTPAMKDRALSELRRCRTLLTRDPFADLPPRDGGYKYQYWMDRSAEAGYPHALAIRATTRLSRLRADPASSIEDRRQAVDDLVRAVNSGEPDALLHGALHLFGNQQPALDRLGVIMVLVACRSGGDCGHDSEIFPVTSCYDLGEAACGPGSNLVDLVSQGVDPEVYAEAFAAADQFEAQLKSGDAQSLRQWFEAL